MRPGSRAARIRAGPPRFEVARVDLEHIEWRPDGLPIKIPYSKTDKSGEPEVIGVPKFVGDPLYPVAALTARVHYAEITAGLDFATLSPVAGKGGKRLGRDAAAARPYARFANSVKSEELGTFAPVPSR